MQRVGRVARDLEAGGGELGRGALRQRWRRQFAPVGIVRDEVDRGPQRPAADAIRGVGGAQVLADVGVDGDVDAARRVGVHEQREAVVADLPERGLDQFAVGEVAVEQQPLVGRILHPRRHAGRHLAGLARLRHRVAIDAPIAVDERARQPATQHQRRAPRLRLHDALRHRAREFGRTDVGVDEEEVAQAVVVAPAQLRPQAVEVGGARGAVRDLEQQVG